MGSIQFVTVAAHLEVQVPAGVMDRHAAASPEVIGRELATRVDAYVRENGVGYYPALAYFREVGAIEEGLLEAAANLAWLAGELAREELERRLRQVFSRVDVESIQPVAFTLPQIRPRAPDAVDRLARHYTPDTLRVGLLLTSLQKRPLPLGMEQFVRRTLWRWLRERFAAMDIASARLV